jgi:lipopolysaccharide/colanic/teichoic acid biosynthesis glycosyltransferase
MGRTFNVVVSGLALALLMPFLLVIGAAIRITMGGPVLFRQKRSGLHGEIFEIVKFRTMRGERHPGEADAARITPLGQFLRTFSLDELPQLWNVVKGEMSIIGPRPTLPEQVVHYSQRQRGRLDIEPGLTGYAQVKGRNTLSWPERIELDLWYIEHRSVWLDVRILAMTALQLLRPEGITGDGGVNPGFPIPTQPVEDGAPATRRQAQQAVPQRGGSTSSEVPAA